MNAVTNLDELTKGIIANAEKVKQAEIDKWQWFRDGVQKFAEDYGYGFDLGLTASWQKPGVLKVKCSDSVVRFELTKRMDEFMDELQLHCGEIKKVIFR